MKALISNAVATLKGVMTKKVEVQINDLNWSPAGATQCQLDFPEFSFVSDDSDWGYQLVSGEFTVGKGEYVLVTIEGDIAKGALNLGMLNRGGSSWIGNHILPQGKISETLIFDLGGEKAASLVFSNAQKGSSCINLSKLDVRSVCGKVADKVESVEQRIIKEMEALTKSAIAIPLDIKSLPSTTNKISGNGVYLRTDYWAPMKAGGSYGHTCYVAKELFNVTEHLTCYMANRFEMLDDFGIEQIEMPKPFSTCNELDVLKAPFKYYDYLIDKLSANPPAYIYERYIIGNYAGAKVSQELGIPYILEYNGSEISLKNSFDDKGYEFEEAFLASEQFMFKQASVIVCVSQVIADGLIAQGIPKEKVLVNPNGCSPEHYKPLCTEEKAEQRAKYGWGKEECVVGFIGTFGGWHGIDILADSLPKICNVNDNIRFLLIGDGNFKHLITDSVNNHKLSDKVVMTGIVPQQEAATLLAACDICVSPHNKNMVDSKFFGSPTKLFEYMSLGTAIVASDLEQIGEVLSPSLRLKDIASPDLAQKPRSVLCAPGDLEDFVNCVAKLAEKEGLRKELGQNAREALIQNYSWEKHVEHIWQALVNINKTS